MGTRLALLLLLLAATGCDSITGASNIEYTATGTAQRVSLTYDSGSGSTNQIASAPLPWSFSFKADRDAFLYVSAQIIQGTGTVQVIIRKNGTVIESATAVGFASIATASGTNR